MAATIPCEPMLVRARGRHRLEAWLWTGPVGHLLGGSLDFAEALVSYARARRASKHTPR
ncbi:MAG TPA: hypothetical protein VHY18_09445 [Solirubrobacteraceae bacterium]|nr:hypothetical protein [Solirubrobacteraceae bacterium]